MISLSALVFQVWGAPKFNKSLNKIVLGLRGPLKLFHQWSRFSATIHCPKKMPTLSNCCLYPVNKALRWRTINFFNTSNIFLFVKQISNFQSYVKCKHTLKDSPPPCLLIMKFLWVGFVVNTNFAHKSRWLFRADESTCC